MLKVEFTLPLSDEERDTIARLIGLAAEQETVETETVTVEVEADEVEEVEEAPAPKKRKPAAKKKPEPEPVEDDEEDDEEDDDEDADNVVQLDTGSDDGEEDEIDWIAKALEEARHLVKINQRGPVMAALKAVGASKVTEIEDQETAKEFYEHLEA